MSRLFFGTGAILALAGALSAFAFAADDGGKKARTQGALREPGPTLPSDRPHAVAQARSGTRRLYVATGTGLFASGDGGSRWDSLSAPPAGNADILAMAVDPQNEARLYAGGRGGLWQSKDGGATWKPLFSPRPARSAIRSIAIAPTVPDTLYVGTDQEGVFRSADAGASWTPASRGLPEALAGGRPAPIPSLVVDPKNPLIAYAATELQGIYKTIDGGSSWTGINQGLGLLPLQRRTGSPSLLIHRADHQQLLAMLVRPIHSRLVKTFVYQSSDGGDHWFALEVELPSDARGVALAEDPADPQKVVLFTTTGAIQIHWQKITGVKATRQEP